MQNPYYFCESGDEASWKEVAGAIGEGLHKAGKINDPTPKTLPEDLYGDVFGECTYTGLPRPAIISAAFQLLTELDLAIADPSFVLSVTSAVIGLNSRSRAIRLRELGWQPREKDWKASYFEDELPEILKEETGSFAGYKGTVAS